MVEINKNLESLGIYFAKLAPKYVSRIDQSVLSWLFWASAVSWVALLTGIRCSHPHFILQLFVNFIWQGFEPDFISWNYPTPRRIEVILIWLDRCLRYVTSETALRYVHCVTSRLKLPYVTSGSLQLWMCFFCSLVAWDRDLHTRSEHRLALPSGRQGNGVWNSGDRRTQIMTVYIPQATSSTAWRCRPLLATERSTEDFRIPQVKLNLAWNGGIIQITYSTEFYLRLKRLIVTNPFAPFGLALALLVPKYTNEMTDISPTKRLLAFISKSHLLLY